MRERRLYDVTLTLNGCTEEKVRHAIKASELEQLAEEQEVSVRLAGNYHPRQKALMHIFEFLREHPQVFVDFSEEDRNVLTRMQLLPFLTYNPDKGYHCLERCA